MNLYRARTCNVFTCFSHSVQGTQFQGLLGLGTQVHGLVVWSVGQGHMSQFDLFTLAAASPPVLQTGRIGRMYDVPDILAHRTKIMGVGSSTPMGVAGYYFEPKRMRRGPPPKLPYKRDELVISQSLALELSTLPEFP